MAFQNSSFPIFGVFLILLVVVVVVGLGNPQSDTSTKITTIITTKTTAVKEARRNDSFEILDGEYDQVILHIVNLVRKQQKKKLSRLPFLTISYAQTLDGMIAMKTSLSSSNLQLSGPESNRLSHALRSIHDGILIGGRTLIIDNPRLNVRLNPSFLAQIHPSSSLSSTLNNTTTSTTYDPRPIVLDTNLHYIQKFMQQQKQQQPKTTTTTTTTETYQNSLRVKNLIICCSHEAFTKMTSTATTYSSSSFFQQNNITLLSCKTCPSISSNENHNQKEQQLDLEDVLYQLNTKYNIQSIMIEGGATVLSNFVSMMIQQKQQCRNDSFSSSSCFCITICPTMIIGALQGIPAFCDLQQQQQQQQQQQSMITKNGIQPFLTNIQCFKLGMDLILLSNIP